METSSLGLDRSSRSAKLSHGLTREVSWAVSDPDWKDSRLNSFEVWHIQDVRLKLRIITASEIGEVLRPVGDL